MDHFLHGVGRRIKLKPLWKEEAWRPDSEKSIEECLKGFDESYCLVNEGQWVYDKQTKKDELTGFGRSIRGDRRQDNIGWW